MSVTKAITIATKGLTFDIVRQSGLLPPMDVLNSFFQCGIDDVESGITLHWEPFALSAAEYDEFFQACQKSIGQLRIDALGCEEYSTWFSCVAARNASD